MTTTYVRKGEKITYANTGSAISSGDVIAIGNSIGVAETDIAATTGTGSVYVEGVHLLTKNAGEAFTQGQQIFWDTSEEELTGTANANTVNAGTAWVAAGSSATTAQVKLAGGAADVPRAAAVAALTDSSGGATADGTIGAVTAPTALTDNGAGATADSTVEDVADIALSTGDSYSDSAVNSAVNTAIASISNNFKEFTTTQGLNRTAIIALTDAVTEIVTKQTAIIAALKAANLMDQ